MAFFDASHVKITENFRSNKMLDTIRIAEP